MGGIHRIDHQSTVSSGCLEVPNVIYRVETHTDGIQTLCVIGTDNQRSLVRKSGSYIPPAFDSITTTPLLLSVSIAMLLSRWLNGVVPLVYLTLFDEVFVIRVVVLTH